MHNNNNNNNNNNNSSSSSSSSNDNSGNDATQITVYAISRLGKRTWSTQWAREIITDKKINQKKPDKYL
jgi:hypothetical protein